MSAGLSTGERRTDEEAAPDGRHGPDRTVRDRLPLLAGIVVAVAALVTGGWFVPPVREVLHQSFTKQPAPYTELYFTRAPTFDGTTVVVPVTVNDHGTGVRRHRVRVTLETPEGKPAGSTTVSLTPHQGAPVPATVRVEPAGNAEVALVKVALVDFPQTLRYSFGTAAR